MKVLMLHNEYLQVGGETYSVEAEAVGLRDRSHDVLLHTVDNERLAEAGSTLKTAKELLDSSAATRVSEVIGAFKPDIVHAQNLFPVLGGRTIRMLAEQGIPWVRTLRNYRLTCIAGSRFRASKPCVDCRTTTSLSGLRHKCYRGSYAASLGAYAYALGEARARKVSVPGGTVLLSEAMRRWLGSAIDGHNVYVKYNPVASLESRNVTVATEKTGIIFAARLVPEKRVDIALSIARALPGTRVEIFGDGPQRQLVEGASRKLSNLHYGGLINAVDLHSAMARCKLTVIPSDWPEPFGRSAAESLGAGTPALVSNMGGLPEVVGSDSGMIVSNNTAPSWIAAVKRVLNLPTMEYCDLSIRSLERWRTMFSPEATTAHLEWIYSDVLARHLA
jgi:glycosyltransferase involved in cell wall biosynthesis